MTKFEKFRNDSVYRERFLDSAAEHFNKLWDEPSRRFYMTVDLAFVFLDLLDCVRDARSGYLVLAVLNFVMAIVMLYAFSLVARVPTMLETADRYASSHNDPPPETKNDQDPG